MAFIANSSLDVAKDQVFGGWRVAPRIILSAAQGFGPLAAPPSSGFGALGRLRTPFLAPASRTGLFV